MKRFSWLVVFLATSLLPVLNAAYSPPVGGITLTVPVGQTRSFALPVLHGAVGAGKMLGRIEAVGSNFIDDSTAGWTSGVFSTTATPYYVRIKTGTSAGRVLLVSANTTTRITVNNDGTDLTQCGIATGASGDVYEIVLADTLFNLFGSTALQGGADATSADTVQTWTGASWLVFYYNTTRSRWERNTDTAVSPSRDTFLLRPDRAIMITRRGLTDLTLRFTGRVPDVAARYFNTRPGVTFLSTGLPVDTTLGTLALQTRAPGWQAGTAPATASSDSDLVQVWTGASWTIFYYDSGFGHWQRNIDNGTNRDTFVIPAGRPVMIRRLSAGATAADAVISFPMTYTISL